MMRRRDCPHCEGFTNQLPLPPNTPPDLTGLEGFFGFALGGLEVIVWFCLLCHKPNVQAWRKNAQPFEFRDAVKQAGGTPR